MGGYLCHADDKKKTLIALNLPLAVTDLTILGMPALSLPASSHQNSSSISPSHHQTQNLLQPTFKLLPWHAP